MNRSVEKEDPKESNGASEVLSLALDLGFRIAIPIIFFGLGGRYLDKVIGTGFLFLILGIVFSLSASSILIIFKIKKIFSNINEQKTIKQIEDKPSI